MFEDKKVRTNETKNITVTVKFDGNTLNITKNDLKVFVDSLGLPKGEFSILSSGSLVLRGIQDEANDLDLHVSQSCFQYIKQNYNITFKDLKHEYNNPLSL